jgi:predicted phosphate transport protein (TIGR00153 family)
LIDLEEKIIYTLREPMGFFPKSNQFFDLFERAANNILQGAKLLEDFVSNQNGLEAKLRKIEDVEHAGDQITHDTMEMLNKTFITPLDREDIHALVSEMDDILDLIYGTANRIVLYKVPAHGPDIKKVVQILVQAVEEVSKAVLRLRNMRKPEMILAQCIEINRLENEADEALRRAISDLFDREKDPIRVIKEKEILETLENATDRCEDVANVLESIVLKNA